MNKIKFIKKVKANLVRIKIHRYFGFAADVLIYSGYMLKMSKWIDQNRSQLKYNDFYNRNVVHKDREKLYAFLLDDKNLGTAQINYLEFGVGRGNSLRWWTSNNTNDESGFWAFDTYEGLPEKYGNYEKGTFSLEGNFPDIEDSRIHFVKGLFQDTLLKTIPEVDFSKQNMIHVDGDLYSSAMYVLTVLYPYLKPGDLILFDEFVVPYHEFKAFDDFTRSFYIKLRPVGAVNNYLQMVFEVEKK
jgi:hypothetical protein